MHDAADAQNGRVGHHAQQDDADKLHLLDIVGGTGDERRRGELLDLSVGEVDNGREGFPAQVTAYGCRHPGSHKAYGDGDYHHQQRQAQHLPAHTPEVGHLHVVGDALGLVFQADQQHGLAGQAFGYRIIHRGHGPGQLLLHCLPAETRRLGHGGKLGADGIQIGPGGRHGFGGALGCGRVPGRCHIQYHVRCGEGFFQLRLHSLSLCRQRAYTVCIRLGVGLLRQGGVLLAHQQFQCLEGGVPHGIGYCALDTPLLNAYVHNFAGVVRQGQIAVGLHSQQRKHYQTGRPMTAQLFKDFSHGWIPPLPWRLPMLPRFPLPAPL